MLAGGVSKIGILLLSISLLRKLNRILFQVFIFLAAASKPPDSSSEVSFFCSYENYIFLVDIIA